MVSTLSYFTKAALEDGISIIGSKIYKQLQNPITKMYSAFLAYILKGIDKLSLDFQAEMYRVHKLWK